MIYTSYFGSPKIRNRQELYSIARSSPKTFIGGRISKLMPGWDLISHWKRNKDKLYYREKYALVLAKCDVHRAGEVLQGKTLLCWEASGYFCHRHLVAEWLREAGYEVREL